MKLMFCANLIRITQPYAKNYDLGINRIFRCSLIKIATLELGFLFFSGLMEE